MKIKPYHRKKIERFLKEFYSYYNEKYTVFHFVRFLKLRLKQNKDAWIAVTGETGVGKSYFVLICQILFGRPFSLIDNVTYIPKGLEIVQKFDKLRFNTLLIDEAAKELRGIFWQKEGQKQVTTAAMTERYKNNAVFLNMPNFDDFTKSLRRTSIIFRAMVIYRTKTHARVVIQRRSRNPRSKDPWGDDIANKMYEKAEKKRELDNEALLKIERAIPNTIMDFIIPDLSQVLPEVTEEYERLKLESRHKDLTETAKASEKASKTYYKNKYEKLLSKAAKAFCLNTLDLGKCKVTKQDIAGYLNISTETLNKYLKMEEKPDIEATS